MIHSVTASNSSTSSADNANPSFKNVFDKDMFFKIFVTELTNQDPLEPMNNKDFIVQMAQFSSVEQLNNLNENLTNLLNAQILSQASEMIGYKVEGKDLSTGKIIQGKVKQVYLKDNQVYLLIGDKSIPFSSITKIISKN